MTNVVDKHNTILFVWGCWSVNIAKYNEEHDPSGEILHSGCVGLNVAFF